MFSFGENANKLHGKTDFANIFCFFSSWDDGTTWKKSVGQGNGKLILCLNVVQYGIVNKQ